MNPEFESSGPAHRWAKSGLLGRLAETIQPPLKALLDSDDSRRVLLKDFLHGTLLGHPLHPALTDIPVGAWSVAAVCDGLELCGVTRYRETADVAVTIGALGAVGAAATGLADWSDTTGAPQRLGMLHAILNTAALGAYTASALARRAGARDFGIAAAFGGYAVMSLSAYLGGELAFGLQLGVKHTAVPVDPPGDLRPVLGVAALSGNAMHPAEVDAIPLLVTRFGSTVHAVSGTCTHRGAPLAEGTQEDRCVRCPWHGSRFSLEDGRVLEGPATFALTAFDTHVTDGTVSVRAKES